MPTRKNDKPVSLTERRQSSRIQQQPAELTEAQKKAAEKKEQALAKRRATLAAKAEQKRLAAQEKAQATEKAAKEAEKVAEETRKAQEKARADAANKEHKADSSLRQAATDHLAADNAELTAEETTRRAAETQREADLARDRARKAKDDLAAATARDDKARHAADKDKPSLLSRIVTSTIDFAKKFKAPLIISALSAAYLKYRVIPHIEQSLINLTNYVRKHPNVNKVIGGLLTYTTTGVASLMAYPVLGVLATVALATATYFSAKLVINKLVPKFINALETKKMKEAEYNQRHNSEMAAYSVNTKALEGTPLVKLLNSVYAKGSNPTTKGDEMILDNNDHLFVLRKENKLLAVYGPAYRKAHAANDATKMDNIVQQVRTKLN